MGPRLKRIRRDLALTQAKMAEDLEISPSYIALMERNQRPVTADLLLRLARIYAVDLADLAGNEDEETARRLQAALRAPMFSDIDLPALDVADVATSYPGFAEAFLRLDLAHAEEQLALADRSAGNEVRDPVSEARAFLAARRNAFPELDASAAATAQEAVDFGAMAGRIRDRHGLTVEVADDALLHGALRFHDYHRRRVLIHEALGPAARAFQLALQLAILEQGEAIEALLAEGRFSGDDARLLARRALQSYWAAALLMPFDAFARAARQTRYDIALLAARFTVSFEQAAHRLTTLQRPGSDAVAFFFLRIDRAGNVSKRLDGAGFPFAAHGGRCPLWNIHHVFDRPGHIDVQSVELPGGERYLSIARTVEAGGLAWGAPRALRAVALVCAATDADRTVYGQGVGSLAAEPIGLACRICHHPRCIARSAPPVGRELLPARFREAGVPFVFAGE
ncbi:ImmA/IrrE family metallo-endopeptidase [Erythrobacter arachoides]|uniref:ImmA/IrrE family metallo-endopeptidase n=1 Tax=Aurantiacibacter arachoides TaxID=1850444 RepID=A0A845A335_9SPHN|nr:short-chain fatty acyl-CoA regulator family protein [Aurantiacibacter arachoides]MXO94114.1 ImmA/IrrE family metallo-endopeptidase [Aurantiacibacter arachoides]